MVIQGHRNWYQLKPCMRFLISFPLWRYAYLQSFPRYTDLLVENL